MEKVELIAHEQKLVALVDAMNEISDFIDPDYSKIAVFIPVDSDKSVRYFVKKRPYLGTDGIERWKFIARKEC